MKCGKARRPWHRPAVCVDVAARRCRPELQSSLHLRLPPLPATHPRTHPSTYPFMQTPSDPPAPPPPRPPTHPPTRLHINVYQLRAPRLLHSRRWRCGREEPGGGGAHQADAGAVQRVPHAHSLRRGGNTLFAWESIQGSQRGHREGREDCPAFGCAQEAATRHWCTHVVRCRPARPSPAHMQ